MVADYDFELKIQKFEIADPDWGIKRKKRLDFNKTEYSGVFGGRGLYKILEHITKVACFGEILVQ